MPGEGSRSAEPSVVSDNWYGEHLAAKLVDGPRWRRSFDLWRAARPRALIVTELTRPIFPLVAFEAMCGRRRLILTQLQRGRPTQWHRRLLLSAFLGAFRPMLRRSVAAAQVLSSWERDAYEALLGIPSERIQFIPAPLMPLQPSVSPRNGYVISSGRALCDWETLFEAAAAADWPLVVICGAEDAERVGRLNRGGRATVYVDIRPEEHQRLVAEASVYVAALYEAAVSSGQQRIMEAHRVFTPVVASNVQGLVDYLVPDVSALVVEPGDVAALREAVNRLLDDGEFAAALARQAVELFEERSIERYIAEIQDLVTSARPEPAV